MSDYLIRRAESHLECCPIGKCKTCDLIRDLIAALKRERKRIAELQQARDQAQAEADRCAREYAHEAQARQRAEAEVERLDDGIRDALDIDCGFHGLPWPEDQRREKMAETLRAALATPNPTGKAEEEGKSDE